MENNKESKKNYRKNMYTVIFLSVFLAIVLIVLTNIFCNIAMAYPNFFGINVSNELSSDQIKEYNILTDCIAIMGLVVTVWAGLNISSLMEKKDVDRIQQNMDNLDTDMEEFKINLQQEEGKSCFIREISDDASDPIKKILKGGFTNSKTDKKTDKKIPYWELFDIEQKYNTVSNFHRSEYKSDLELKEIANQGIVELSKVKDMLSKVEEDKKEEAEEDKYVSNIKAYLDIRTASFNFYKGYCVRGGERWNAFKTALGIIESRSPEFGAKLPQFDPDINIKLPDDDNKISVPENISEKDLEISAYACNYIGESYSKILQERKRMLEEHITEKQLEECQKKALFYCAHAVTYRKKLNEKQNNERNNKVLSVYTRNYGCAIQRAYGEFKYYDKLKAIYKEAFDLDCTNINNFKVRLDLYDAKINKRFGIKFVEPDKDRDPSFSVIISNISQKISLDFTKKKNKKFLSELEELNFLSAHTKMLHPTESFGYRYACIYFRDMCIFYLACSDNNLGCSNKEKAKAKAYFDKAEENWETVNLISPYDPNRPAERPMTQVLRNDLDALKKLLK